MRLIFADHELDLRRQELRRRGEVVHVEPQVFDLLTFLLRNHDRIVSKDEILDAVWDGRIVSEAALSSRINAARKALGDNGADQILIRTFHKRGFRFMAEVTEHSEGEVRTTGDEAGLPTPAPLIRASGDERATSPAAAQSGKPSIAVMPFANLSDDAGNEYFAYGLTEDVIRLLGRNRWLRVLTRHATAGYRGQEIDAPAVGAALGVRYVVQGSVRKQRDAVRIAAELVLAEDNTQLWSEAYDLRLADIFDIQETMAKQIAAVIEPELARLEQGIASRKPPANLDAWDCYQRGLWHLWGFTSPGFDEAETMFRRSIELEPGLARAHAGLSYVQLQKSFYVEPPERPRLLEGGMASARVAVSLDERDSLCRCVLGRAFCLQQQYDAAIAELEETIAMNPSFAQGYFALAFTLVWCGRHDEAIALLETACELSPRDPHLWTFHHCRAVAHFCMHELESAEVFARKAHRHPSATSWAAATLATTLGHLGRSQEAASVVAELLGRRPGYTRAAVRDDLFFCADGGFIERYLAGLALAGLPA